MKQNLPEFLSARRGSVIAAIAIAVGLLLGASFLLPHLSIDDVRADSNPASVPGRSVDFEPHSRHWAPAYNHNARKPSAGKLKRPRVAPPAPSDDSAGN